jgi:hypothetical protein
MYVTATLVKMTFNVMLKFNETKKGTPKYLKAVCKCILNGSHDVV